MKESPIIQADDYYPFGLTFNSYQRVTAKENKYNTFQDQEKITSLDLNWIQFKWRNYDPAIGRFFNLDPLTEDYYFNSPYAFSENKVISHIEIEGLEAASANAVWSHGKKQWDYASEKVSNTAEKVSSTVSKGLDGVSGIISSTWSSFSSWVNGIPKESTPERARGDGVTIEGSGSDDSQPRPDKNGKTTNIDKEFMTGLGVSTMGPPESGEIFENLAEATVKMLEAKEEGEDSANDSDKVEKKYIIATEKDTHGSATHVDNNGQIYQDKGIHVGDTLDILQ